MLGCRFGGVSRRERGGGDEVGGERGPGVLGTAREKNAKRREASKI